MDINFERLDAAITYGFEHPDEFNMDSWLRRTSCGTTGCLAGTAVRQAGWVPRHFDERGMANSVTRGDQERLVVTLAAELLGLNLAQVEEIFYASDLTVVIKVRNQWARRAGVPERNWDA